MVVLLQCQHPFPGRDGSHAKPGHSGWYAITNSRYLHMRVIGKTDALPSRSVFLRKQIVVKRR